MNDAASRAGQQVKSDHPYAYRSGQWAEIVTVVEARNRECWLLSWPDGATDIWPVHDPVAEYQFAVREA